MSSPLIKSPIEMLYEQAGIPHMSGGGQPPPNTKPTRAQVAAWAKQHFGNLPNPPTAKNWAGTTQQYVQDQLKQYGTPEQQNYVKWQDDRHMRQLAMQDESDKVVPVYRADPANRFKGNNGLETQPTYLDPEMIQKQIAAIRAGEKYGVPKLSPQQLKTFYPLEGRSDMGFNGVDFNDAKALELAEKLKAEGHHPDQAYYAAALYNKNNMANRLHAPLPQAWNGFGTSEYGKTGLDYNKAYEAFGKVVDHPQNKEFNTLIDNAYNNPQMPQPTNTTAPTEMPPVDTMGNSSGMAAGGSTNKPFYDMSRLLIQKHLSGK